MRPLTPDKIDALTREIFGKFKYSLGLLEMPTGEEARTHKITLRQKCDEKTGFAGFLDTTVQGVMSKDPARCAT